MSGKRRYPQWFDGHKVNEILFCEEFRKEHPIICIKGKFFTKDGLIEDDLQHMVEALQQTMDVIPAEILAVYTEPKSERKELIAIE